MDSFQAIRNPLTLLFGVKLVQKRWRKSDRQFMDLAEDVNAAVRSLMHKTTEKLQSIREGQKKNIVQLLYDQMKKTNLSEQEKITEDQIIDEIKTFMIAGTDTTSNFLTACIFYVF